MAATGCATPSPGDGVLCAGRVERGGSGIRELKYAIARQSVAINDNDRRQLVRALLLLVVVRLDSPPPPPRLHSLQTAPDAIAAAEGFAKRAALFPPLSPPRPPPPPFTFCILRPLVFGGRVSSSSLPLVFHPLATILSVFRESALAARIPRSANRVR